MSVRASFRAFASIDDQLFIANISARGGAGSLDGSVPADERLTIRQVERMFRLPFL